MPRPLLCTAAGSEDETDSKANATKSEADAAAGGSKSDSNKTAAAPPPKMVKKTIQVTRKKTYHVRRGWIGNLGVCVMVLLRVCVCVCCMLLVGTQ